MKRRILSILVISFAASVFAVPTALVRSVTQADDESVTITYDLDEPAVVTVSILFEGNVLGDETTQHVSGDVNCKLQAGNNYSIKWFPDVDWPGHKFSETKVKVRLTAWPLDDTPDYMVVDLSSTSDGRIRYFTSTKALPGGILANKDYRQSKMVFRKIRAKDVTWMMGPDGAHHAVKLDHNYYIGVFELTAQQYYTIYGKQLGYFTGVEWWMRSVDDQNILTTVRGITADSLYPKAPDPSSVLGKLRTLCGNEIDFDLPSEAQWEFAARGGANPNGYWGDGSPVAISGDVDVNLSRMARYAKNDGLIGGTLNPYDSCNYTIGPTNGVAIVGSYEPNQLGLYDMHGNCGEYCIDMFKSDIAAFGGAIVEPDGVKYKHVFKGGRYQDKPGMCLPSYREGRTGYSAMGGGFGCRFACRAGLK